jgi:predicted nuclease of predicted toxin-antitoxin system
VRLLADENFPGVAVAALRSRGHDVAWIRTDAPGSGDRDVLARAEAEGRLLITFDKDFGELAFRLRLPALYPVAATISERGSEDCSGSDREPQ